jgi:hypothetical protein
MLSVHLVSLLSTLFLWLSFGILSLQSRSPVSYLLSVLVSYIYESLGFYHYYPDIRDIIRDGKTTLA